MPMRRSCYARRSRPKASMSAWPRTPPQFTARRTSNALELKDGRSIPCGLVVMAVGVRPNTALASASRSQDQARIVVDDALSHLGGMVYAIGECAEHRGTCYGLVEPAYEQARVLASAPDRQRRALSRLAACDEPQGVRRAGVLGRRLRGQGARADRRQRFRVRHPIASWWCATESSPASCSLGDTTDALWYRELIRIRRGIAARPRRARIRPCLSRRPRNVRSQDIHRRAEALSGRLRFRRAGEPRLGRLEAARRAWRRLVRAERTRCPASQSHGALRKLGQKALQPRRRPSATSIRSMPTRD